MSKILSSILISALISIGGIAYERTHPSVWDETGLHFGTTSFPSSLDALTNPNGTDPVNNPSHSAQHSNANDALEALEAKVGVYASTPIVDTIFGGNGTGISGWFAWATSTRMTATNFLATGSSTLQNFTFVNATGSAATTTNFFSTNASSTNLFSTTFRGGGISTCTGTNFLQWSNSTFSCGSTAASGLTTFSTTTVNAMATTTFRTSDGSLPTGVSNYDIIFEAPATVGANADSADTILYFNNDLTTTYTNTRLDGASAASNANRNGIPLYEDDATRPLQYFKIHVANNLGMAKMVNAEGFRVGTTTGSHSAGVFRQSLATWENTAVLTQLDIVLTGINAQFGSNTKIQIVGY